MRGQVRGWLYIVCERTGGLGSDNTRAGRAGQVGSDGGSDWRGTGSDLGGGWGRTGGVGSD